MVPPSSNGISRAPLYLIRTTSSSPTGLSPLPLTFPDHSACSCNLASSAFAHHYSRNLFRFLFLWILRCFNSPGLLLTRYLFTCGYRFRGGFPHSDIDGSQVAHTSSPLFAVCHVFLRLLVPRHPPVALLRLENIHSNEYSLLYLVN